MVTTVAVYIWTLPSTSPMDLRGLLRDTFTYNAMEIVIDRGNLQSNAVFESPNFSSHKLHEAHVDIENYSSTT